MNMRDCEFLLGSSKIVIGLKWWYSETVDPIGGRRHLRLLPSATSISEARPKHCRFGVTWVRNVSCPCHVVGIRLAVLKVILYASSPAPHLCCCHGYIAVEIMVPAMQMREEPEFLRCAGRQGSLLQRLHGSRHGKCGTQEKAVEAKAEGILRCNCRGTGGQEERVSLG